MTKSKTIRRRTIGSLSDSERYDILKKYSEGYEVSVMARELGVEQKHLTNFIQSHLKNMLTVRETNELMTMPNKGPAEKSPAIANSISKCLTPAFIQKVEENAYIYAYYFIQTGDNEFALKESGLDIGIPKSMKVAVRRNIMKIRGQYLRDIPAVASYIRGEQDKKIKQLNVDKPYVQHQLVEQIEQLKALTSEGDTKHRTNLLKSIELLGKTIGAFTERVEVEEGNAKSGLDILMERIQKEETGQEVYEISNDQAETT